MKKVSIDSVKHIISTMILQENDKHAQILIDLTNRINTSKYNINDALDKLNIIHETKVDVLEEIYSKLKEIK